MPQPSWWVSVRPPRWAKPVKLNTMSVGTLQFMARSWHMDQAYHALAQTRGLRDAGKWVTRRMGREGGTSPGRPLQQARARFLVQYDRVADQGVIRTQDIVDFRHCRFACDQV